MVPGRSVRILAWPPNGPYRSLAWSREGPRTATQHPWPILRVSRIGPLTAPSPLTASGQPIDRPLLAH
eukprot:6392588-Alexandrium_andersonii.AAC.1